MTDSALNFFTSLFDGNIVADLIFSLLFLVLGFLGLIKGADIFVDNSCIAAAKLKIPLIVIGLTIVAFGTSAPELAVSISSAVHDSAGIAVGNILGSNIMNILLILGISAVFCALPVKKNTFRYEIPFVVLITVVILLLGIFGGSLDRLDGIILLLLFVGFMVYLIRLAKNGDDSFSDDVPRINENTSVVKMVVFIILGLAMIVIGSNLTVSGASEIARIAGLDERIIGLTVVAFGTSLPELVTSVQAARKGKTDIAIGNIIGSNIFNILFVGGVCAAVSPNAIEFGGSFIIDSIVAAAAAALLWALTIKNKRVGRLGGAIMLVCYAAYFAYLFIQD